MQYQGITGRVYCTEENIIAKGGEGSIYPIQNSDTMVVKIFKPEKRTPDREAKLTAMIKENLSEIGLEQVVWPQDVIYEQGDFVGYVMPKLKNTDSLITLYSSGTVGQYDLRHRLLAALNLCYAVQTVHDMGQVCGDLNPQNICVNLDEKNPQLNFHVTLVDVDSYHYQEGGRTYRCEVGITDYLAPEIQNKLSGGLSLKTVPLPTYTKETDLFALAVHIFTLLMNGSHPFACAKDLDIVQQDGVQDGMEQQSDDSGININQQMDMYDLKNSVVTPQPNENMKNGFFTFYHKKEGITIPVYAPKFDTLPECLRKLFVCTFVDGYYDPAKRTDTREWIETLRRLIEQRSLVKCMVNTKHYYFSINDKCPLCEVEERIREINEKLNPPVPLLALSSHEEQLSVLSNSLESVYQMQVEEKRWFRPYWVKITAMIMLCFILACFACIIYFLFFC